MKILMTEDDSEIRRLVQNLVETAGHEICFCETGGGTLNLAKTSGSEVIVLDVGLPDISGFEVLEQLRRSGVQTPVLFLTAHDTVTDRVRGLTLGADDYLAKPFAAAELLARLEALHRRASGTTTNATITAPCDWKLDANRRRVTIRDRVVELQPREWNLLQLFLLHQDTVVTKAYLLDKIWDIRFDPGTNVVDAMVCRLRRKLDSAHEASFITTLRGQGYVFKIPT
jgi:DNA-binding response OmpR family regulator